MRERNYKAGTPAWLPPHRNFLAARRFRLQGGGSVSDKATYQAHRKGSERIAPFFGHAGR